MGAEKPFEDILSHFVSGVETPPGTLSTQKKSFLVEDSEEAKRRRREREKDGNRKFAKVIDKEHFESNRSGPEGELQNSIPQNPWLDTQRFDGVDNNLAPDPPINSEAYKRKQEAEREQEMERQLRLGIRMDKRPTKRPRGF